MKKTDEKVCTPPPHDDTKSLDPIHQMLNDIIEMVPVSCWSFARIEKNGAISNLVASLDHRDEMLDLNTELHMQKEHVAEGPRIAATLIQRHDGESGVTLVFAHARAHFGILTMLRTDALGGFTSSEIRMLTFALSAVSDALAHNWRYSVPRRAGKHVPSLAPRPLDDAFYLLDDEFHIVLAYSDEHFCGALFHGITRHTADRLPGVLEQSVRKIAASWKAEQKKAAVISMPLLFLVLRAEPMSGSQGEFIGVRISGAQPENSLTSAAEQFRISRRELQVLSLLLDGNHLDEIALQLSITSSTVQDHINSMLDKTDSVNRSKLISRMLGWDAEAHARSI